MQIKKFSPKDHKIKALVYGKSWTWKTTFWGTAQNALFASAENWLLSIANKDISYVDIKTLNDLIEIRDYLKKWEHKFETLVIDSITEISEIIKADIQRNTKRNMQLQDWWVLAQKIEWIIKDIKEIDINVIVVAQELIEKDEDKFARIVPSLNGKSSTKIAYYMDVVGYMWFDKDDNRIMYTWRSAKLLTKDRTWLLGDNAPLDFEEWRELVSTMNIWEEKIVFDEKTNIEEIPEVLVETEPKKIVPEKKQVEPKSFDKITPDQIKEVEEIWSKVVDKKQISKEEGEELLKKSLNNTCKKKKLVDLSTTQAAAFIKILKEKI